MKNHPILFTCLVTAFLPAVSRGAMTAYYSFNESAGSTAADSVRGASGNGTLTNFSGTQWVAGVYGNAVEFDGFDDYILALNAVPTGSAAFSIAAWVWADSAAQWGTIVKNWGGATPGAFHLGFDLSSGQISNYVSPPTFGPVVAPNPLPLGSWQHVALTFDGGAGVQTLYINGTAVATAGASATLTDLTPNMSIGVKTDDTTLVPDGFNPGFWDGKLDELMIFNHTLTPAEVATTMVPEPSVAACLVIGAFGLMRRRR